jgi:hypothetical protein
MTVAARVFLDRPPKGRLLLRIFWGSAREGGRLGPPPLFELRRVREPSKVAP